MVRYTGLQGKLFGEEVDVCSVGAEAWLKKALHTIFEVSSGCQSWVWPAQILCNDQERVGCIKKQDFQEEEMWGPHLGVKRRQQTMTFLFVYISCQTGDQVGLQKLQLLMPFLQVVLMMPGQMQKTFLKKTLHLGLYASLGWGKGSLEISWLAQPLVLHFSSLGFGHRLETHYQAQGLTFLAFGRVLNINGWLNLV